jgi:putative DNA primase/helicase
MSAQPDRDEAERFFAALDPNTDAFTLQTFDDNQERRKSRQKNREPDPLAKIFHGSLARHWSRLVKLNAQSAGVYVTINETDLEGREKKNIKRVRACFVDLDGAPLPRTPHVPAHIITETSPGRWHVYWRVADVSLNDFSETQKRLIEHYGADKAVHDLPRVMRVPGFFHCKREPFVSRLIEANDFAEYRHADLLAPLPAKPADLKERQQRRDRRHDDEGSDPIRRLNTYALGRLDLWVKRLFPGAQKNDRGYRISSSVLGRDLEEDISITKEGIKDFGVHDLGDADDGCRTPIDLVKEWLPSDFSGAVRWLCQVLGQPMPNDRTYSAKHEIGLVPGCAVEMKRVDWLWSNHLACGKLTLLSGPSELGKSSIAIDWVARLTNGSEWPDGDSAPLGSAVIISSEDAIDDTIVPRLAAAGADLQRVHLLAFAKTDGVTRTFSLQADLDRLGAKINAIGDVSLVVIDPITSYMGTKIDSHHTVDVRAVLEPLQKFAERFDVAVLMISHPPKAGVTNVLNAVSGSGAFVDAPRMTFIVIKDPDNSARTLLLAGKNNIMRKADGMGYSTESAFVGPDGVILTSRIVWDSLPVCMSANEALEREAERKRGSSSAEAEGFLRERLGNGGGVLSKDLEGEAEAYGIKKRTLERARRKLGVKAQKDGYAAGWRLFLEKERVGGKDS